MFTTLRTVSSLNFNIKFEQLRLGTKRNTYTYVKLTQCAV